MEHSPSPALAAKLIAIWQSVLGRSPIGVQDDFFALGGDPAKAVELFDEIARACGRELPPLVIYHAPTIRALAAVVAQPALAKFSPLVPLKAGADEPPVFMAHGLGGSVMEFFGLVDKMQSRHPIYGLQAIGNNGADVPFERIEDMAEHYARAIQHHQKHGPYLLIGYSLGGLVALEIAQRLTNLGEKIGLLTMLDAYPYQSFLRPWQRVRLVRVLVRHHAAMLRQLPPRQALSYVMHPAERLLRASRNTAGKFVRAPFADPLRQARDCSYLALTRYQPRPYAGTVRFAKAAVASVFPDDAAAAWAPWMKSLAVESVPGDHHEMLSDHFATLAAVLTRHLREAN